MCGIFGLVSRDGILPSQVKLLAKFAEQRGKDSSGLLTFQSGSYRVQRADFGVTRLMRKIELRGAQVVMGHSRLITNGMGDNQPVVRGGVAVLHNGIVLQEATTWERLGLERRQSIDTELIAAIAEDYFHRNGTIEGVSEVILAELKGAMSCAITSFDSGELVLFSNTGSLFMTSTNDSSLFASERYPLEKLGFSTIEQVRSERLISIPASSSLVSSEFLRVRESLIPKIDLVSSESDLLQFREFAGKRCTKCILPETMPFIEFDSNGVCNFCLNYKPKLTSKPLTGLLELVAPHRGDDGPEAIVPFSGGRDSSFALHLIVKELGIRPVTYTYDWGMVTDLGRRNISLMTSQLGVENIVVAADIEKKRSNIRKNLLAWLRAPHLGMLSILTAGDKHFFQYVENVKRQTGTTLNLWGTNPLETTHFKAGFLGVAPDFVNQKVYSTGLSKQIDYQTRRFLAMLQNPSYFNSSLGDTLSGEYFRSFAKKTDYHHVFDYWKWDETEIESVLLNEYGWETAPDTRTTWRIGDGTAGFYNYAYYTVAGFSEHDTFRSNQIREGQITREEALSLVRSENQPRYQNIKWYLSTLGLDFPEVIRTVNSIPRLF